MRLLNQTAFDYLECAFVRAGNLVTPCCRRYRLAGQVVEVRVAGGRLGELIHKVFMHLPEAPAGRSGLVLEMWDEEETGISVSDELEKRLGGCARREIGNSEVAAGTSPALARYATRDGRFLFERATTGTTAFDRRGRRILVSAASCDHHLRSELTKPAAWAMSLWLQDNDRFVAHAGLVGVEEKGILLSGHAGQGKSTTTLSCFLHGYRFLGDDFVALSREDGAFQGHSVYGSALLRRDYRDYLPSLPENLVLPLENDKEVVFPAEFCPERLRDSVRINALVRLQVTKNQPSRILPISRKEVLPPLVFHLLQAGCTKEHFALLAGMTQSLPCYRLRVGDDAERVPELIRHLARTL